VFFGAIAVVLVTATTALVGREWQFSRDQGRRPARPWPPGNDNSFFGPRTDDGTEEKDEEDVTHDQENLNVLHLLYTIAQVRLGRVVSS
jgi:hypothetical protein